MPTPPTLPDLTLLRRIGGGSYGDVWIARTLTGIYRAVKIVDRARFPDERPFLRELDGITRFQQSVGDQPRQLALLHVGRLEDDGILYYTMELADDIDAGTEIDPDRYAPLTLKALHERRPFVPAAECIRLGVDLARALAGLHTAGLIHRDVKPSNIIFVAGVPKLADIGLVSSSDHTLTSLGTPGYSPPEGSGTARADIYSLGKILYELVTGLATRDFPRLPPDLEQREDAALLLELNEVILRACEPDPNQRYASAQAMLDDLLLLQAGKSVKELLRARELLQSLRRVGAVLAVAALVVITFLAVRNYVAARALAAQETAARQRAEHDERLARYVADLHLAQLTLASDDLGLARAALRRQIPKPGEPDLRGREWRALWNETAGDDERVLGEVGGPPVRALALSPDGRLLATQEGETDRTTVVWDLQSGTRRVLASATNGLGGFTADSAQLIVGTLDRHVRLIDVATGAAGPVQAAEGRFLASASDGRTVLIGTNADGRLHLALWDAVAQTQVATWQSEAGFTPTQLGAVAISADKKHLAVAVVRAEGATRERQVQVWNLETNALLTRRTDIGRVTALRFSPDARQLAVAAVGQPIARLNSADGQTIREFPGHSGEVGDVAFSPDGRQLASVGDDQSLRVWDVERGSSVEILHGHEGAVGVVQWSAEQRLTTVADDGTVRVWRVPPLRIARTRGGLTTDPFGSILFSPDSTTVYATLANGRLGAFDALTLEPGSVTWDAFRPLAFSGTTLRAVTREFELVNIDPAADAVSTTGLRGSGAARVMNAAASDNGRYIAIGRGDGTVEFWDADIGRALPIDKRHATEIWALAVAPDGSTAASVDRDGQLWLWQPATGRATVALEKQPVAGSALAFSKDGAALVLGLDDGGVMVFSVASGTALASWRAHTRAVYTAAISPDGSRLATGGIDGPVIVWSLPEHRQLAVFPLADPASGATHERRPQRVRFAPDGSQLVVLVADGSLRRWRLK